MGDAKATTIKDALNKWQEKNKTPLAEALYVGLQFQWPPIEKMDANLAVLKNCEKLSLSTNCIEKIVHLDTLRNLKILSLARNNLKNFNGIEKLADTLEELWISYNYIDKLKGIMGMKKLKVLYMSNNLVDSWNEVQKLLKLETLQELVLTGNPIQESMEESIWRAECIKRLTQISILDGIPIIRD
ncbi:PREDICTED: dynein light chain 1, axonemal-like [Diuraphis noxia]|uniref:dynein light chain 1, axonemal-like n=1 Tax=Diuraphis noxia TaxID=143948 RepID=UPI0007639C8E|nr:PREDICTED: dynein light chain 1, axonemal-like [Diuraphis noxia]